MADIKIKEIIRSRRKTLSMMVNPDATLTVKAPLFTPLPFINIFIQKNQNWITKQINELEKKPKAIKHKFIDGEEFLYLGKLFPLKIDHFLSIAITDSKLCFPKSKSVNIKERLLEWYKREALEIIDARVTYYAKKMKLSYSSVRITQAKSRWGSCSHDNNLRFNWKLVLAPIEIIDYVVVHELAHVVHKNHSSRFWMYVRNFIPDGKRRVKWLKVNGQRLNI